ncbi:MAG: hypothetical protein E6Q37_10440 [Crocinitomicaceae bacterium]|nr:MAG: hypothetical protein E6Q37_10440 [Crocinitomicaceae bacterium]
MIQKAFFLILVGLIPFTVFSQDDVETVKIRKSNSFLYRGMEEEVKNVYIYIDHEGTFYLVNLDLPVAEARAWFEKRKDSQNIYKARMEQQQYQTLLFIKENEPGTRLSFYLEKKDRNAFQLTTIEDNQVYTFQLVFD